ncbi:CYTH domain-containing protein [Bacillus sp. Marseille-Q1617]|uniref:CYTH domain-containing protein n=1 Tax=Bacillus sp. Marseille-Q1617 TaxID=2736887 RepID=UPI00158BE72F|nr:CYTH domain-containing protein [Bacillus sp. Marseille-Q1617]
MSQEIEIEFKNLLAEEEFVQLTKHFKIKETDFTTQENHYFDTPDYQLKDKQSALRIRLKKKIFTLTLKTPVEEGLLETNQPLTVQEADDLLERGVFPDGEVKEFLESLDISPPYIQHFGSLITKRAEIDFEGGLLVFDESSYFDKVDFELEYEVKDYDQGEKIFFDLLKEHGIPKRETENKIKRFYREKVRNQL